jgi:hypothetical protein
MVEGFISEENTMDRTNLCVATASVLLLAACEIRLEAVPYPA